MQPHFDHIAQDYDTTFTHTPTGRLQRDRVHNYLRKHLPNRPLNILELNCGTGEDALFLATLGHQVHATDLSEKMVKTCAQKAYQAGYQDQISTQRAGFYQIREALEGQQFDLIFSNFGGVNCIDEAAISQLFKDCKSLLRPGARMIWVVMSRFCGWETMYFFSKGRFREGARRWNGGPVYADLGGIMQRTWYYGPKKLRKIAGKDWTCKQSREVGLFLPPSFLDPFFAKRPKLLERMRRYEDKWGQSGRFAAFSDHFLIDFELKSELP